MTEEIQTEIKMKLNSNNLKEIDVIMKKMLESLTKEELNLIADCKITKTVMEMDINAPIN